MTFYDLYIPLIISSGIGIFTLSGLLYLVEYLEERKVEGE